MHSITLLELRNIITLLWFLVALVLVILFGWYLLEERGKLNWWDRLANKLAVPLFLYFLGGAVVGGGMLTLSPHHDRGMTTGWVLFVAGGGLSMMAAIWLVYVLAPRRGRTIAIWAAIAIVGLIVLARCTGNTTFVIGP